MNKPRLIKLAVARDRAFCFYYEDNFDLLRAAGAELVFFSPLTDSQLPDDIDGIYIGGGYPELHAAQLSGNSSMLRSVRDWAAADGAIYAECGGLMYLSSGIHDLEEHYFSMAGVFPFETVMKKGRSRLGYREICLEQECVLGSRGVSARGHEFHYSEIRDGKAHDLAGRYTVKNGSGDALAAEGYACRNALASYIHLHFGSNSSIAGNMVNFMKRAR
jgi:cobyrinic acid a,c-diamide synthase